MRLPPLHIQILAAMVLGAAVGLTLNLTSGQAYGLDRVTVLRIAAIGEWAGQVFLALLQMVVVPLVFASIVTSLTGLGARGGLAGMGLRVVTYYAATSAIAVTTGLVAVNLLRPGDGVSYDALMGAAQAELGEAGVPGADALVGQSSVAVLAGIVYRMIPTNIFEAASSNRSILAVIFFAVLFGVFTTRTGGESGALLTRFFAALQDVMLAMTHGILAVAPLGIFGYVLFVTAQTGVALAGALGWYALTVSLALVVHGGVTLPLILYFGAGRSPALFFRQMSEALATAFSTASSAGTLPLTMRCATVNAGLPERVTSFTLPLGATVNMDGTALYEVVAVLFVAQMLGDLSLSQQVIVAITALLASVGAAGIPHAGTVMMVIVLAAVGLPTDAVLVILAVDRVLDMGRTAVNVWSDSVGAAVVTAWMGETAHGAAAEQPR